MDARCWCGEEKEELFFSGYRVSIWEEEKFWRWMVAMVVKQHEIIIASEIYAKIIEMLNFVTYILSQSKFLI